jgi:hypothetical protein
VLETIVTQVPIVPTEGENLYKLKGGKVPENIKAVVLPPIA